MLKSLASKCNSLQCARRLSFRPRKEKHFYDTEGKDHRRYFYVLDHRALLFLEEAKFRNYATCLKDKTFLNFFFKQLRNNDSQYYSDIPFVSLCGKELNFLSIDDPIAAVVFGDLVTVDGKDSLTLGFSNLQQTFDPSLILSDYESGRLYHPVVGHKYLTKHVGLLNQTITDTLSSSITTTNNAEGLSSILHWNEKDYAIANISPPIS